jgi:hypothetical protein
MTNSLYDGARQAYLGGDLGWDSDDVRVMLVKSTYTYASTHNYISNMGSVDNGRSAALASKTYTNGIADAADITLTATAGVACNALVIFKHTGADTSARLIAYIDTATGLPLTPSTGATVSIAFANTTNKIFKL